ncbi:hypothetical protein KTAU_32510 [Thermogemmatispora aurantia]|jgi:hypothetical protein|uniref:Uncharacterized protein n=1 Tax=Thermogemmatispora aurantia TaxID=2045279 RepID=A0A5J4KAV0_9CHLR|nr:hypothetical protein KTAU_32510 [Thermogemmatispora aurantia]
MQEPASSGLAGLALIDGAREATREALPSEGSALVLLASLLLLFHLPSAYLFNLLTARSVALLAAAVLALRRYCSSVRGGDSCDHRARDAAAR